MKVKRCIICVGIVLFLVGCSSTQFGWKEAPGTSASKKKMNESFDPLSLNDDDIKIEKKITSAEQDSLVSDLSGVIQGGNQTTTENVNSEELAQGFRVQLLATTDEKMAREEKKKAVFKFEDKVYLIFEAPMYKVRVGNCLTRKEAEVLKNIAVRQGFSDAWIVPSLVVKH